MSRAHEHPAACAPAGPHAPSPLNRAASKDAHFPTHYFQGGSWAWALTGEHLTRCARAARLIGDVYAKGVALSDASSRLWVFGTAQGHNGPRAMSKMTKWGQL
mmetsp:Transcript_47578/g.79724  ORF Transcript_47578/g.79724 Transcript_47578/m.79724 type:complete len:103 (+) Transcript_47578:2411-2719(+)